MGIFTDLLVWLDNGPWSEHQMIARRVKAMEKGLCLSCGQPTGAPKGWTKMWCEDCSHKMSLFNGQET